MKKYKILHLLTGYYVSCFHSDDYIISVELYRCDEATIKCFEERMVVSSEQVADFIKYVESGKTIRIFDCNPIEVFIPAINEFDIQEVK